MELTFQKEPLFKYDVFNQALKMSEFTPIVRTNGIKFSMFRTPNKILLSSNSILMPFEVFDTEEEMRQISRQFIREFIFSREITASQFIKNMKGPKARLVETQTPMLNQNENLENDFIKLADNAIKTLIANPAETYVFTLVSDLRGIFKVDKDPLCELSFEVTGQVFKK